MVVKCNVDGVNNIEILEHIDPNLEFVNFSGYCVIDSFKDIFKYKHEWKYDHQYLDNNTIYIELDSIKFNERIKYHYYVVPKKSGIFSTNTILRIGDAQLQYPDQDYPLDIEVSKPRFDVELDIKELEVYENKPVDLIYRITPHGQKTSYNVKLEMSNNYCCLNQYEYVIAGGSRNLVVLNYSIIYPKAGEYSLPAVWIVDEPYTFPGERITVVDPFRATLSKTADILIILWGGLLFPLLIILEKFLLIKNFYKYQFSEIQRLARISVSAKKIRLKRFLRKHISRRS